jgi:hypothetical protein
MTTTENPARAATGAPAIPETMRAIVCYAPGDYRLETVAVPLPGPLKV